jgi:hypothetical protein
MVLCDTLWIQGVGDSTPVTLRTELLQCYYASQLRELKSKLLTSASTRVRLRSPLSVSSSCASCFPLPFAPHPCTQSPLGRALNRSGSPGR